MKRKAKLGESRIFIDDDLTREEREIQRKLRERAKLERGKGKRFKIGPQKISIEGE